MTSKHLLLVVLVAFFAVLGTVAFRWVREQQLIAKKAQLEGRFGQLRLALQNYHQDKGTFPDIHLPKISDTNARSWRVELLAYVEMNDVYDKYAASEPWNGPSNRQLAILLKAAPPFFRSPFTAVESSPYSDFLAVAEQDADRLRNEGCQVLTVKIDGSSFSIVEIPNSGVHWMDPVDVL